MRNRTDAESVKLEGLSSTARRALFDGKTKEFEAPGASSAFSVELCGLGKRGCAGRQPFVRVVTMAIHRHRTLANQCNK